MTTELATPVGHLHLDHDNRCCQGTSHKRCGQCTRGYLCQPCNIRLGYLESGRMLAPEAERDAILEGLAVYLTENRSRGLALDPTGEAEIRT